METISVQRSKPVSGLRPFKNPKRRNSRGGSLSRSGGSLALPNDPTSYWSSSPMNQPPQVPPTRQLSSASYYSQPPLLPLPRVNSSLPLQRVNSSLPLQRVNSSKPRVNIPLSCNQTRDALGETQKKKVQFVDSIPRLTRTGSVPVQFNKPGDFPKGFDGYPGPAIMLLSPPPSSLPIPRFSMKPKQLSCKAEVAGKQDVATDNIRRVLQLR